MDNQESVLAVRPLGVGVHLRRDTVGRPACVRDAHVALRLRLEIDVGTCQKDKQSVLRPLSCLLHRNVSFVELTLRGYIGNS